MPHVRTDHSTQDALDCAKICNGEVVFLAIGFETTTPPTAVAVKQAVAEGVKNFSILCDHVLTPAAMHAILTVEGGVSLRTLRWPGACFHRDRQQTV